MTRSRYMTFEAVTFDVKHPVACLEMTPQFTSFGDSHGFKAIPRQFRTPLPGLFKSCAHDS